MLVTCVAHLLSQGFVFNCPFLSARFALSLFIFFAEFIYILQEPSGNQLPTACKIQWQGVPAFVCPVIPVQVSCLIEGK